MGTLILFIISLVAATMIVNGAQQLYMKVLGANAMFFRAKPKIIAIIIIALFITGLVMKIFGIGEAS